MFATTSFLQSLWNERGLELHMLCYLVYIALGGLCFFLLEGEQEKNNSEVFMEAMATFLNKNPSVSEESLNEFLDTVAPVVERPLCKPNQTSVPIWTYSQSMLFAVSLVTTVGYGQVAPETEIGKITCVIYAYVGIQLNTALLQSCVRRLMKYSRSLRKFLSRMADDTISPLTIEIIHQLVIMTAVALAFFVFPALTFYYLEEDWSYLDALYFCFITLRTVGLGDYVPSENPHQPCAYLYRMGITVYIITGIMAMNFLSANVADFRNTTMNDQKQDSEATPVIKKNISYGSIV